MRVGGRMFTILLFKHKHLCVSLSRNSVSTDNEVLKARVIWCMTLNNVPPVISETLNILFSTDDALSIYF